MLKQIAAEAPDDCLLLAPAGHPLHSALAAQAPSCRLLREISENTRVSLALLAGTLETLAADEARQLLATLRDRAARHSLLWVDLACSPLSETELRALGFRLHAQDGAQALFGFDLFDYKDRPDWLNPRHWAHPERWDRERW